jgi:hypothetical protein
MHRTGEAMVMLARGGCFEGAAEYDGCAVTIAGRRRLATRRGGELEILYGAPVTRTWPITEVLEIRWQES